MTSSTQGANPLEWIAVARLSEDVRAREARIAELGARLGAERRARAEAEARAEVAVRAAACGCVGERAVGVSLWGRAGRCRREARGVA